MANLNNSVVSNASTLRATTATVHGCLDKLNLVFREVQSDEYATIKGKVRDNCQQKLLENVWKIYDEVGAPAFSQTLMRMMVFPFQSKESNVCLTRVIDFFHEMIIYEKFRNDQGSENGSPNETINSVSTFNSTLADDSSSDSLPICILKLCLKYHGESRSLVRIRLLRTVEKILSDAVKVPELSRKLQIRMIHMLHTRSKDKSEQVRALAVKLLSSFIGDGLPLQNEIIDVIIDRMSYDPSVAVRTDAVSSVIVNDDTFEQIVERTGDPSPAVRAAALKRIAEDIKLSSLTFEMRDAILKANSSDESPKNVQKALLNVLMQWLDCLNGDPCELMRVLNVRRRPKLCRKALNLLYNQAPEEAYEKLSTPVLKDKKYPDDSLCVELTFIWLYLYERFKDEPYIYKKLALPLNEMIDYITEYVEVVEEEGDLVEGDLEYRGWMLGDLLQILGYLPNEEGERLSLINFLPTLYSKKRLMDARNSALGVKLISLCSDIKEETHLIDLVNSVLDSDRVSTRTVQHNKEPTEGDLDELEAMKLEMATLRHKSRKLERDRDLAAKEGDLYKAQVCQDEIVKLEQGIENIKKNIDLRSAYLNNSNVTNIDEDEEEQWVFSDKTMLIVVNMVKTSIIYMNHISSFSRTFYEMYVTKGVSKCADPYARAHALELMCVIGLEIESECAIAASYSLTALLRDKDVVKYSALKCLYDLVLRYSFAQLGENEQVQKILMGNLTEAEKEKNSSPTSLLKTFVLSFMNCDNTRLVQISVAGVLKLLFRKELSNSAKLITNFLCQWAIPLAETIARFKDVEIMIPMYATLGEDEAIEVAKCLVACIKRTIIQIRSRVENDTTIPHPDIDRIVNLVVKATDPLRLDQLQRPYIGHQTIAEAALQELRRFELSVEERTHYTKLLKVLNLGKCPVETISRMKHIVQEMTGVGSKTMNNTMAGFANYLSSFLNDDDDNETTLVNDNENDTLAFDEDD